jgi:hypothetical protein
MAQGKKSFIIYTDSRNMVNKLSNERAGILFKTIFSYCDDENPTCDDEVVDMAFEHFKNILKRDLKKYEGIINRNKENGKKGGRPKKPSGLFGNPIEPKKADNDNDNDILIQPKVVIDWDALLVQFNQLTKRNHKLVPDKAKRQLLARLKDGYTKQDIWNAIQNCYDDEYHKETNHKYLTLEFISRPDKMERYSVDVVKSKKIDKSEIGKL